MVNSIGFKKLETAVFISGNGSNLKKLIEFSLTKKSPIKIVLVISNNSKAKGLNYAKKFKIKKKVFKLDNTNTDENKILKHLKRNKIKLICLAGFMKILSGAFIKKFKGKILNIHPSLLPKYKGLNTHDRALENNEKFSGCTVHIVTPKLDSGEIIMQKKVYIKKSDNPKKLGKRILKQEHILYAKAIMKLFSNP
tara:strand:+ start:971 stop:1555 length:585 start_codon:yes stop_codon:yes gene_type:complete